MEVRKIDHRLNELFSKPLGPSIVAHEVCFAHPVSGYVGDGASLRSLASLGMTKVEEHVSFCLNFTDDKGLSGMTRWKSMFLSV